ncbi:MAG TPA: ABC transporter substrate-binding protein [Planctomycetota bacterium]|nr:ABC transporter substrate-binding protein [Planctomycetota bacterium]HQA99573.1 ABC transporter substrate-binding protein [Planctomycetota bacterium]
MKYFICIFCCLLCLSCRRKEENNNHMRIISTYRPTTHIVLALGKQHTLVGIHPNTDIPLFQYLIQNLQNLVIVGSKARGVNIETVVSLNPNIVLLYDTVSGGKIEEQLSNFGIRSFLLKVESIVEIQESLLVLGKELHVENKANIVVQEMDRILQLVQKRLTKNMKKKRIFFASSSIFLRSYSKWMLQNEMIERAGGIHVVDMETSGSSNISLEQLVLWNPDCIILSPSSMYTKESIYKDKKYQVIRAVQQKQIFEMPHKQIIGWDFPCPDSVLGILWLSMLCYPELFQDITLEKEMEQFYQQVYCVDYKKILDLQNNFTQD